MKHEEFIAKWKGKRYEEVKGYGFECVWLSKLYLSEVLGLPTRSFWWSAYTGWLNKSKTFPTSIYERIVNEIESVPEQWDIIFFDRTKKNPYGHVGIVHEADKLDVTIIEQNGDKWSSTWLWGDAIRLQTYKNYKNVLGWYSLKSKMKVLKPVNGKIYWYVKNFTPDMDKYKVILVFEKVFGIIGRELYPIRHESTKNEAEAHITLEFVQDYEKEWKSPNWLAYATYPNNNKSYVKFNDKIAWDEMFSGEPRLANTALHELLHSHGMKHTNDRQDVMNEKWFPERPLRLWDITKTTLRKAYWVIKKDEVDRYRALIASTIKPWQLWWMKKADKEIIANILDCKPTMPELRKALYR